MFALFTDRSHRATEAGDVLSGLLLELFAPPAFLLALALMLPGIGLAAFGVATGAALSAHGRTMLAIPRGSQQPSLS